MVTIALMYPSGVQTEQILPRQMCNLRISNPLLQDGGVWATQTEATETLNSMWLTSPPQASLGCCFPINPPLITTFLHLSLVQLLAYILFILRNVSSLINLLCVEKANNTVWTRSLILSKGKGNRFLWQDLPSTKPCWFALVVFLTSNGLLLEAWMNFCWLCWSILSYSGTYCSLECPFYTY